MNAPNQPNLPQLLIKICGLRSQAALDAAGLGQERADFCGFIFHPASPRFLSPEAAGELEAHGLGRVGVFVSQSEAETVHAAYRARLDLIQLHGEHSPEAARRIREKAEQRCGKAIRIIRVLWPARYATVSDLETAMASHAAETDFFLLDAGKAGGGSGQRLDRTPLAGLNAPRPWLLAGGLGPDTVLPALAEMKGRLAGVDLNSGLESQPGHKDEDKIRATLRLLRTHC